MGPYDDPLDVQVPALGPLAAPTPEAQSDLAGQWRNWLANENNRSALMQFGVSLMQPMDFGQTPTGHIGQAIGSVGELGSRREASAMKQQEIDSKADLRGAQAAAAEARAATAGQGAARQADRLQFQRERLDADLRDRGTRLHLSALLRYQQARKAHDEQQALVPPAQRQAFPDPATWMQQNGLGGIMPNPTSPNSAGDFDTAPQPNASTPAQAPPPGQRMQGQTYMTPRGPMVWEGTGWRQP